MLGHLRIIFAGDTGDRQISSSITPIFEGGFLTHDAGFVQVRRGAFSHLSCNIEGFWVAACSLGLV
jgi:hypothetical protein